jgi:putative hydrolase of the HAD superfamily
VPQVSGSSLDDSLTETNMDIRIILFDADGVLQRPSALRPQAWQGLLGPDRDAGQFVSAVFHVEEAALVGGTDFVAAFSALVREWRCEGSLEDALAVWTMIEPDAEITQLVRALRKGGVSCCLATNQERHRASYMSEQLGYSSLFDRAFYSCRMGVAKPSISYFRSIVDELGVPPAHVLFIDDREPNVSAAQDAGLNATRFLIDLGAANLTRALADFGVHVV